MKQARKINESNLDPELLAKIFGSNSDLQQDFVDLMNARIKSLDEAKQAKAEMSHYFSKTEQVPESNIDKELVQRLNDHLSHKIDYSDLHSSLAQRISGYENDSLGATALAKQVQVSLNSAQSSLDIAKSDISNIYKQLATLQSISSTSGGNTSSSSVNTEAIQGQISSVNEQVSRMNEEITKLSMQVVSLPDASYLGSLQEKISQVSDKLDSTNIDLPTGLQGESVIIGENSKLVASGLVLIGTVINAGSNEEVTCEKYILEASQPITVFDICNNVAYIDMRPDEGGYSSWMAPLISEKMSVNGTEYGVISNAFTSWFGNNKFVIDQNNGRFGVIIDGNYIEIYPANEISAKLRKNSEEISELQKSVADLTSAIGDIQKSIASMPTIASFDPETKTLELTGNEHGDTP